MTDLTTLDESDLTGELRRRGFAVCVFQPGDVEDRIKPGNDPAEWLWSNRSRIEDRMSEEGNETIDTLLSFDGVAYDPDEVTRCVTFVGQAWVNDNALTVDDSTVRYGVTEAEYQAAGGDDAGDYDALAQAARAPQWVKDWAGPFEVYPDEPDAD